MADEKPPADIRSDLDKWFERRREAAEAAITMLAELNGSTDQDKRPAAWQRLVCGAMARIMDDVQAQFDLMSRITNHLAERGEAALPTNAGPGLCRLRRQYSCSRMAQTAPPAPRTPKKR